jgi:hypothetical protein
MQQQQQKQELKPPPLSLPQRQHQQPQRPRQPLSATPASVNAYFPPARYDSRQMSPESVATSRPGEHHMLLPCFRQCIQIHLFPFLSFPFLSFPFLSFPFLFIFTFSSFFFLFFQIRRMGR